MSLDLEEVRALVNPYGYRAQWYPGGSTRHISVWPRTMEAYRANEEIVLNLLTLAGLSVHMRGSIYVELGGPSHPALLIFNP